MLLPLLMNLSMLGAAPTVSHAPAVRARRRILSWHRGRVQLMGPASRLYARGTVHAPLRVGRAVLSRPEASLVARATCQAPGRLGAAMMAGAPARLRAAGTTMNLELQLAREEAELWLMVTAL